jgi:hypothetical protein
MRLKRIGAPPATLLIKKLEHEVGPQGIQLAETILANYPPNVVRLAARKLIRRCIGCDAVLKGTGMYCPQIKCQKAMEIAMEADEQ